MPDHYISIFAPSDITFSEIPDGSIAVTIALKARSEIIYIAEPMQKAVKTGSVQALSSEINTGKFDNVTLALTNLTPLLGSGGDIFEICINSETIGFGFTFSPVPGVTYFAGAPRFDSNPQDFVNQVCFAQGTMIRTNQADKPVEQLQTGDLIWIYPGNFEPLLWVDTGAFDTNNAVKITAPRLGSTDDLILAPSHRLLISGPEVELLFGEDIALVEAQDLLGQPGAQQTDNKFYHLLFGDRQLVQANGVLCESFFPNAAWIALQGNDIGAQIREAFPKGFSFGAVSDFSIPTLMAYEAGLLSEVS